MNKVIVVFFLCVLFACGMKDNNNSITNQHGIDSTIIKYDTATILGIEYKFIGTTTNTIVVLAKNGDTVLNKPYLYYDFELTDFNHDGFKDIVVHYITNIPTIQDLFLFDSSKLNFIQIKDFDKFPDPKPITGTKYYFSYHQNGCADSFWVSELFYIDDNETHLIGRIEGNECEGKLGISVFSVKVEERKLIKTFSLGILESYQDRKWGFIADYWTTNYLKFSKY